MVNNAPQNNISQQDESEESISLVALLENPDPDFDVVVEKRGADVRGRIRRAIDELRPAPPNSDSRRA